MWLCVFVHVCVGVCVGVGAHVRVARSGISTSSVACALDLLGLVCRFSGCRTVSDCVRARVGVCVCVCVLCVLCVCICICNLACVCSCLLCSCTCSGLLLVGKEC